MNTEHPAQEVIGHFRQHNILIGRQFPPMNDYIRVSLGIPAEMLAFWKMWDMLPWSKQLMQHQKGAVWRIVLLPFPGSCGPRSLVHSRNCDCRPSNYHSDTLSIDSPAAKAGRVA